MAKVGNQKDDYKPNDVVLTPKYIFDALKIHFDLDPAHPPFETNVPCKRYYTETDDGLSKPWEGLVWVNPPFSASTPWIDKFIEHGNGIMLTQLSRSKAYLRLWQHPGVSILQNDSKHMAFELPNGKRHNIFMPVALFAMGKPSIQALYNSGLGRVR
jgi:hypothetical protein